MYSRNTNISGNKHNLRTSMNERTHFFIKIYISHALFLKGLMFLWCVRDWWRQGQTAILTQQLLLTIARCVIFKNPLSTSSASWLGLLNWGLLRATALSGMFSVCKLAGLPVSNFLNGCRHLPIFFHNAHLLPLLLSLIYTGASLIDGLVKGQYITKMVWKFQKRWLQLKEIGHIQVVLLRLIDYQLLIGFLMLKFDSFVNVSS